MKFGDNLEDEWFVVFLLFEVSRTFPSLSIRVWDTDGEFLLIEAAFHLPRWLNPENSTNRVFIRQNEVHIIPRKQFQSTPTLKDALKFLIEHPQITRASDSVQSAIKGRISDYPERARRNVHRVRVRVPVSVAQVSVRVRGFIHGVYCSAYYLVVHCCFSTFIHHSDELIAKLPPNFSKYQKNATYPFCSKKCLVETISN